MKGQNRLVTCDPQTDGSLKNAGACLKQFQQLGSFRPVRIERIKNQRIQTDLQHSTKSMNIERNLEVFCGLILTIPSNIPKRDAPLLQNRN
jgi:hypothetical protein